MVVKVDVGRGQYVSARVAALLRDARKGAGLKPDDAPVVQGSWADGSLSAGTHSGGGAFDLSVKGLTLQQQWKLIRRLRERNVCAWIRSERYGWTASGAHIHGIVRDEPGLSAGAKAQVAAYDRGLNGLANNGRDPHARPKQKPFAMPDPWPLGRQKMVKDGEVHTIPGGRWVTLAVIDLPADGWFENTLQLRMPKGVQAGEARLGRLGWGGDDNPDGIDKTGHNPIPAASLVQRWRTPIKHTIKGGGPLAFQVYLPDAGDHKVKFVAKSRRVF